MAASPVEPRYRLLPGEPLVLWVRVGLALIAAGLVAVFAVAIRINPYGEDGRAATMATHRQLGLPPCNFVSATGMPCPSCGLTTSFALTVRADPVNAARANWVGLLLACFCLLLIPWGLASAAAGRALFLRSLEKAAVAAVLTLFVLLLLRWAAVLWALWSG